jgi:hypothetical protein
MYPPVFHSDPTLLDLKDGGLIGLKPPPPFPEPDMVPSLRLDGLKYIASWSPQYADLVGRVSEQLGPISERALLSVCIPVAGDQEALYIGRCLECFTNQTVPRELFELVLLVNWAADISAERRGALKCTLDEIARVSDAFPSLQVRVARLEFRAGTDVTIGLIRSLVNDAVVQRRTERSLQGDHLLMRADSDTRALRSTALSTYIRVHNRYPQLDLLQGSLAWSTDGVLTDACRFAALTADTVANLASVRKSRSIKWVGPNSTMRMSSYCAFGGYDQCKSVAEDADIYSRVFRARREATCMVGVRYAGSATRLHTSSRRAAHALTQGIPLMEQWSETGVPFAIADHEIRLRGEEAQGVTDSTSQPDDTPLAFMAKYTEHLSAARTVLKGVFGMTVTPGKEEGSYEVDFSRLSDVIRNGSFDAQAWFHQKSTKCGDPSLIARCEDTIVPMMPGKAIERSIWSSAKRYRSFCRSVPFLCQLVDDLDKVAYFDTVRSTRDDTLTEVLAYARARNEKEEPRLLFTINFIRPDGSGRRRDILYRDTERQVSLAEFGVFEALCFVAEAVWSRLAGEPRQEMVTRTCQR